MPMPVPDGWYEGAFDDAIREGYAQNVPSTKLAQGLNVSTSMLKTRARHLGLQRPDNWKEIIHNEARERGMRSYQNGPQRERTLSEKEIARLLGRGRFEDCPRAERDHGAGGRLSRPSPNNSLVGGMYGCLSGAA